LENRTDPTRNIRASKHRSPTAIKNIERQLADGRRYQRIARAIKPTSQAALTKVEIITECTHIHPKTGKVVTFKTVKTVDTRKALETAIIERNKRYFAQAHSTPRI
jgi:hypothetical protein